MGFSKSSSIRKIYNNTILPQEIRQTSNRQANFTPRTAGKRKTKQNKQTNKSKVSKRKEIMNIRTEINENK